jgi:hypothetical protein
MSTKKKEYSKISTKTGHFEPCHEESKEIGQFKPSVGQRTYKFLQEFGQIELPISTKKTNTNFYKKLVQLSKVAILRGFLVNSQYPKRSQEKGSSSEISTRIDPKFLQEIGLSASSS